MHASRPASEPGAGRPSADEAVSEVVGQILMFGILSMVLIMSLLTFNIAKDEAQERVVETTAGSVAQRISSLVIDTAIFAESFEDSSVQITSELALPRNLENKPYTIEVDGAQVIVAVESTGASESSSLFNAGSASVHVCSQSQFGGGPVAIHVIDDAVYTADQAGSADIDCGGAAPGSATYYIYLEPTT